MSSFHPERVRMTFRPDNGFLLGEKAKQALEEICKDLGFGLESRIYHIDSERRFQLRITVYAGLELWVTFQGERGKSSDQDLKRFALNAEYMSLALSFFAPTDSISDQHLRDAGLKASDIKDKLIEKFRHEGGFKSNGFVP